MAEETEYELSAEPGAGGGIAVGAFTLAAETVSLVLPRHWRPRREHFFEATLVIPDIDGATFSVELRTYDDPAAIRTNDLERYLSHPAFPPLSRESIDRVRDANGIPDFEQLTVRASGTITARDGGDRRAFWMWRKLGLRRPNMIRVIEAQLEVSEDRGGSEAAGELRAMADHLLKFTRFADHETIADRIAASAELKSVALWDVVHMRLPPHWRGERKDALYAYDHEGDDRWTLWIGYNVFSTSGDMVDPKQVAADLAESLKGSSTTDGGSKDIMLDPMLGRPDESMVVSTFESVEDGETLHHTVWDRIVRQGNNLIIGHFSWVVVAARRDEPDMRALTETVEREVRNAVLYRGHDNDENES